MNDYIKRSMGILVAICLATFVPACSGSKTVSSSSGKKPTVSVASSRPCSSCCSSSPVSSTATSAASSTGDSSKGTAPTQHTGGKPASTTGKSTGRTTGGGTGKTTGATTRRGTTGGGTTGGGNGGGEAGGNTPAPDPALAPTGFATQYNGANYGCTDADQYAYVLSKARNIENSSRYQNSYATIKDDPDGFQQATGYAYSDEMNEVASLSAACSVGGRAVAGTGSAYDYFTGRNTACGDRAKALEACLQTHGYAARLCWNSHHMWVKVSVHGQTVVLGSAGQSETGEGYNYG